MNFSKIKEALLGELFILPLTRIEEEECLNEHYNLGVVSLEKSVDGRGEDFHPRLSSQQLEQLKGRLISVYSKGQLANEAQLTKRLAEKLWS